jgi:hypothetical protein
MAPPTNLGASWPKATSTYSNSSPLPLSQTPLAFGEPTCKHLKAFRATSKTLFLNICHWPNCKHVLLFFTFLELKLSNFGNVNTLSDFPFQGLIFIFFLNFQQQSPFKNQHLPHLSSENLRIKLNKYDLLRAFQEHQEHPKCYLFFIEKMVQ